MTSLQHIRAQLESQPCNKNGIRQACLDKNTFDYLFQIATHASEMMDCHVKEERNTDARHRLYVAVREARDDGLFEQREDKPGTILLESEC